MSNFNWLFIVQHWRDGMRLPFDLVRLMLTLAKLFLFERRTISSYVALFIAGKGKIHFKYYRNLLLKETSSIKKWKFLTLPLKFKLHRVPGNSLWFNNLSCKSLHCRFYRTQNLGSIEPPAAMIRLKSQFVWQKKILVITFKLAVRLMPNFECGKMEDWWLVC